MRYLVKLATPVVALVLLAGCTATTNFTLGFGTSDVSAIEVFDYPLNGDQATWRIVSDKPQTEKIVQNLTDPLGKPVSGRPAPEPNVTVTGYRFRLVDGAIKEVSILRYHKQTYLYTAENTASTKWFQLSKDENSAFGNDGRPVSISSAPKVES